MVWETFPLSSDWIYFLLHFLIPYGASIEFYRMGKFNLNKIYNISYVGNIVSESREEINLKRKTIARWKVNLVDWVNPSTGGGQGGPGRGSTREVSGVCQGWW